MYELTIEYLPGKNHVSFPRNAFQLRAAMREAEAKGQKVISAVSVAPQPKTVMAGRDPAIHGNG